ncbi:hypothetical protein PIB30_019460 [Stylosanthes scabra]|uniref:Uncharacterized protein n=1 Tax=Stylosanthes scabra TaxID=79078 RepID=A0ABU6S7S4_9FABA|nr:hypothetical protein [Stylosanthes scabra]
MSNCDNSTAHPNIRPARSGFWSMLRMAWSVLTMMVCLWKYCRSRLAETRSAKASSHSGVHSKLIHFLINLKKGKAFLADASRKRDNAVSLPFSRWTSFRLVGLGS